jgi:hypothetical protein
VCLQQIQLFSERESVTLILSPQSNTRRAPFTGTVNESQSILGKQSGDRGNRDYRASQRPKRALGLKFRLSGKATIAYFGARSPKQPIAAPAPTDSKEPIAPLEPATPLGLSSAVNSRKLPPKLLKRRGRKEITTYGKDMLKDGCAWFEQNYDRRQLTFGTATLPSLSADDLYKLQSNWGKVANRFMEELAREYKRRGQPFIYLFANEVQIKRWLARREVGLHMHWLCVGRPTPWSDWTLKPAEVADIWGRVLARFLGYRPDTSAATRIEIPRKRIGREMSKYLSKGCSVVRQIIDCGEGDRLPNAWWGCETSLRREIKKSVIVLGAEVARSIQSCLSDLRDAGVCSFSHLFRTLKGISTESGLWVADVVYFRVGYAEALTYLIDTHYSFTQPVGYAILDPKILAFIVLDKLLRTLLS